MGWSLGITDSRQLNKKIELTSSFTFQNFRFQPSMVGLVSPTVAGYYVRVSEGENSKVYNFSFSVRIILPSNRI